MGENKTENGNGSYENPFATLELAHASVNGHYDKIIINIFNGTYLLNKELVFDTDELTVQGISGEAIIIAPKPFGDLTKAAFRLSSSNSKFFMNNITFDGTGSNAYSLSYFVPISGEANMATFTNCRFTSMRYLLIPSYDSYYINCVFENLRARQLYNDYFTDSYIASFKNSIFLFPSNFQTIPTDDDDDYADIQLDGIWFGQNSVPKYVKNSGDSVKFNGKYAIFSASETYIGKNQYEIIGKLTWNDNTLEGIDNFQPMTVTLSSSTGDIQANAVLVNGTFKAVYNSTSSNNLVNVVLDSVEIPLSFNSINLVVDAPSIVYGDTQNITVTFPQIVSGNITVLVDETPVYVGTINNDSIIIPVTDVLAVGIHNVNVTFSDAANHIYGFNTTSFTVSKVSNYDFNATVTPTSLYIGDSATVTISLPSGATGNVTVKVGDNEAKTFNINDIISIGGFVAGNNVVNITFISDIYDTKSVVKTVVASAKPTTLTTVDVTTTYNVAKDLVITLTDVNGKVLANKTINVVVGTINKDLTTNASGQVGIDISSLTPDTYTASIAFAGDELYNKSSTTAKVTVKEEIKTNITIPEIVAGKATTTTITLPQNATGNVTVTVDGNVTSVVNLTNGSATVTIPELPAGKHNVTISYSGDDSYAGFAQTSAVEVKEPAKPTPKPDDQKPATVKKTATKITAKKKTFKAKTKVKKYTITLKAGKKAVKKVQVILKIGKKTFKAKTNAKGKATFKIKKLTKKGKYTAKITFKGNKLYKATTKKVKITVKK